ncbi:MAG: GNAT family N-acetyltransferase [Allosphingosinicella sp.]
MTLPSVQLSEGGLADLAAVMAVMEDSFDPSFGEAWTSSQCAGLLPLPGVWLTLGWISGEVAGFTLSRAVAGEAELLLLAVRRKHQRHGVGKVLLDEFMNAARIRCATRLHLEVREGNHAVKLYERAGFSLVGRRPDYYSGAGNQNHDALTLGRSVSA